MDVFVGSDLNGCLCLLADVEAFHRRAGVGFGSRNHLLSFTQTFGETSEATRPNGRIVYNHGRGSDSHAVISDRSWVDSRVIKNR